MNVSISYKCYIHVHFESYKDVEYLKISTGNVSFKSNDGVKHFFDMKQVLSLSVTQ